MAKKPAPAAATAALPPVDDAVVDVDDALPPWPGGDEEDAPPPPVAPAADLPPAAPATPTPVAEPPAADPAEPPTEPPATPEVPPAEPVVPAEPVAPGPQTLGPSQRTLARLGWDAAAVANMTEDQAADLLGEEVIRQQQTVNANQHLIRIGQAAQERWDTVGHLITGQQAPVTPAEPKKPGVVATLKEKLKALGPEPEFDPLWERSGLQSDGTNYFAPANAPHMQQYADKLNAHKRWHQRRTELVVTELPNAIEQLESAERAPPDGSMTIAQFEKELERREQHRELKRFVTTVRDECGSWIFEKAKDGTALMHPMTRQPVPTEEGRRYFGYCNYAFQQGMLDPRAQHHFAMIALNRDVDRRRTLIDGAAPTTPHSAPATSVAPATTAEPVSKARQKARATRSPVAAVALPGTPTAPTRQPSFGDLLTTAFADLPESAFGIPDDGDD